MDTCKDCHEAPENCRCTDRVHALSPASPCSEIRWRCPACGCYRATLQKPDETEQQATNRVIDDHIKLGCAAYSPNCDSTTKP
jgi:hypothetical protein